MPSVWPLVLSGVVFVVSVLVTRYVLRRRLRSSDSADDPALEEASQLRRSASALNDNSSEVEARAKRLEQLLQVQRRDTTP